MGVGHQTSWTITAVLCQNQKCEQKKERSRHNECYKAHKGKMYSWMATLCSVNVSYCIGSRTTSDCLKKEKKTIHNGRWLRAIGYQNVKKKENVQRFFWHFVVQWDAIGKLLYFPQHIFLCRLVSLLNTIEIHTITVGRRHISNVEQQNGRKKSKIDYANNS